MEVALAGLGVVNPAGVVITKLATPAASGWNDVIALVVSAEKTMGLAIVPTEESELERVTLTEIPVRIAWMDCAVSVDGLNWAAIKLSRVSGEVAVVAKS